MRRCISSAEGDPPKLTLCTVEVSYSWRFGSSVARQIIVGTAVQIVTPSRSIVASAASGSNLPSGMTSLMPPIIPTTSVEWQPATWNKGDVNSETCWVTAGGASTPSSAATAAWYAPVALSRNTVFCRLATIERWVLIAPLGRPVVPDV